jgi:2-(1,2-epoxy-1,2-dihydrophenyl)acetyl-CoA isomerase
MGYEQLIVHREGPVATLRLNNPSRLNALSRQMTVELIHELERIRDEPEVRAVLLTGEGRAFCSGADLGPLKEPYLAGERPRLSGILRDGYNRLIPLLAETPKPVVAALNGVVAGAGASLALACDLRIAADDLAFSLAFIRIGLIPDSGASYFLPRTVGMGRALELALLNDRLDAAAALEMGVVNRVVASGSLLQEARSLAQRVAEMPTVAMGLTKRMFREASTLSLADTLEREADTQDEASTTEDHLEGVLAFLEKRPARFTGR